MYFIRKLNHFLSQKRKLEKVFSSYKYFLETTITATAQSIIDNYLYTTPATYTSTPNANILTQHSILPNSIFLFANV